MKKYVNFSKYFNINPRFWIVIGGVAAEIAILFFLSVCIESTIDVIRHPSDEFLITCAKELIVLAAMFVMGIAVVYFCWEACFHQTTLVYVHIGNSLRERGFDVKKSLDEIEEELAEPMYAQIHRGLNKSMDFIITRNWIVGTDDLLLMSANAVRIADIASVDLAELDTYSFAQATPGIHANKKHYDRIRVIDKENRVFSFSVLTKKCQLEAYDFLTKYIASYTTKNMINGNEKLGYEPIKYERGEIIGNEYKSKCFGYCFKIPDGAKVKTREELERESSLDSIVDFSCRMPNGVEVAVTFQSMDGSVKDLNLDYIGNSMVEAIERRDTDRKAFHYGVVELFGEKFVHSGIDLEKNGFHIISELYTYYAPYCQIIFVFIYTDENKDNLDALKQAFSKLETI